MLYMIQFMYCLNMKTFSCFGAFSYRTQLPVSHGSRSDLSQTLPLYSPVSKTKVSFVKKEVLYSIDFFNPKGKLSIHFRKVIRKITSNACPHSSIHHYFHNTCTIIFCCSLLTVSRAFCITL